MVPTGRFEQQHTRLFTGPGALLKSVQFSDRLQARLEQAQRVVVQSRGSQGGGVKHIMRHFSFAAHRFESWTGPRRKYACCIHAVALLLCDIAGDCRLQAAERRRAEAALEAMTPQNLMEVGLAADFGEICMRRHIQNNEDKYNFSVSLCLRDRAPAATQGRYFPLKYLFP